MSAVCACVIIVETRKLETSVSYLSKMCESYWTKRRRLLANVEKQLANINDLEPTANDVFMPVNQSVCKSTQDECAPTAVTSDVADRFEPGNVFDCKSCDDDDMFVADYDNIRSGCDVASSESDSEDDAFTKINGIRSKLATWATKFSVTLLSLSALLEILKPAFPDLPTDPRTLLGTPTNSCSMAVKNISGGSYHYFGIANNITTVLQQSSQAVVQSVCLQLNVDGVPLFKSTSSQFWPLLGRVYAPFVSDPFVIALFYGNEKPKNLDFLMILLLNMMF